MSQDSLVASEVCGAVAAKPTAQLSVIVLVCPSHANDEKKHGTCLGQPAFGLVPHEEHAIQIFIASPAVAGGAAAAT